MASYRSLSKHGDTDCDAYVFARQANYPACLIELCTHTGAQVINNLFARPQQVAEAIAQGIAAYAGIGTTSADDLMERLAKIRELATI